MEIKQNNFKIKRCIALMFTASIILMLFTHICAAVDISPNNIDAEITFDEPKAAKQYYTADSGVRFVIPANTTTQNATVTVPVMTWTTPSTPLAVNITCPVNRNINPSQTSDAQLRCSIQFKVSNTVDPGGDSVYEKKYEGKITATATGTTKTIPVVLKLKWLPPEIAVAPSSSLEKLRAGKTTSGKVTIKELRGYKAAHSLNFELDTYLAKEMNLSGVKVSLSEAYIDKLDAGASKDISINIEVPERNLKPGNYTGGLNMGYKEAGGPQPTTLFKFEIPYPKLGSGNYSFDFPDLGIPYQSSREFTINEADGFIPIEGIRFNITKAYNIYEGEEEEYPGGISWITFDNVEFVPAGGSVTAKLYVNVPTSAKIGKYRWEGKLITSYAGSTDLSIGGKAELPGCSEIKQKLEGMASLPVVKKNANADGLIKGSLTLLGESECMKGLTDVLTVASASETLVIVVNEVNSRYNENKIDDAYKRLVSSRAEVDVLNKMSTSYPEYRDNVDSIKKSVKSLWEAYALLLTDKLEKDAEENRYTDPKLCSDNYNKISVLYGMLGDTQKSLMYAGKSTECQQSYGRAEETAKEVEAEAKQIYDDASTKVFTKSGYKVVPLLFNYPEVNNRYNESISKYDEALNLWTVVEKPRDVARVKDRLEKLNAEKEMLRKTAVVYAAIIVLLILFSFIHFSRSSAKYNRDTLEANLSKVVSEQRDSKIRQ